MQGSPSESRRFLSYPRKSGSDHCTNDDTRRDNPKTGAAFQP